VQREIYPLDIHIQIPFQSRDTRRAQITPGADKVCEYLKPDAIAHFASVPARNGKMFRAGKGYSLLFVAIPPEVRLNASSQGELMRVRHSSTLAAILPSSERNRRSMGAEPIGIHPRGTGNSGNRPDSK
jgi:hypothetical protein